MTNEQGIVGAQHAAAGADKQVIAGVVLAPAVAHSYTHATLPPTELSYPDHMLQLITNHFSMAGLSHAASKHAAAGLYEHLCSFHAELEPVPVSDEKATAKDAYEKIYTGGGAGFPGFFRGWAARAEVAVVEAAKRIAELIKARAVNATLMLALKAVKDEGHKKAGGGFWIIPNETLSKVEAAIAADQAVEVPTEVQAASVDISASFKAFEQWASAKYPSRAEVMHVLNSYAWDVWQDLTARMGAGKVDTELLDWLDNNLFHRQMDEFDGQLYGKDFSMWVFFAPKRTGGGTARERIGEAKTAAEVDANRSKI